VVDAGFGARISGVLRVVFLGHGQAGLMILWAKIIFLSGLVASVWVYVAGAERAKGQLKTLEAVHADLLVEDERKAGEIDSLNARIAANNARLLAEIEVEQARVAEANKAADEIRIDRDRITAALAQSRKSWDEVMANDARTRDWAIVDVPPAAFDRLRDAAGQN